jgi:hypothetical protein
MPPFYSEKGARSDFLCIPPRTGAASRMIITFELPATPPVPQCGACRCDMHLARIEWETERIDLQTFDCRACDDVETRSIIAA